MAPLIATMPALPLIANYTVEWVAIDPATGDDVTGVTITNPTLYGVDLSGDTETPAPAAQESPLLTVAPGQTG